MISYRGSDGCRSLGEFEPLIDAGNVQHYCKHSKELKSSQTSKALHLVRYDCVRYVGDQNEYREKCCFLVLPLNTKEEVCDESTGRKFSKPEYHRDYNKTIYTIHKNSEKDFECNCQGWQTRSRKGEMVADGVMCAHVLALFFCFKLKRFGRK